MDRLKGKRSSGASPPARPERDELEMLARSIQSSHMATCKEPFRQETIGVRPDPGVPLQLPNIDEQPSAIGDETSIYYMVLVAFFGERKGPWWIQAQGFLVDGLQVR